MDGSNTANEELLGAIARGWCAPGNARKEMDADLAQAILAEIRPVVELLVSRRVAALAQQAPAVAGRIELTDASLREAAAALLGEIDDLIGESQGVYGLHLNGDPAPWDEIVEGGRFERLSSMEALRAALAQQTPASWAGDPSTQDYASTAQQAPAVAGRIELPPAAHVQWGENWWSYEQVLHVADQQYQRGFAHGVRFADEAPTGKDVAAHQAPAVAGLEAVGWQQRYLCPEEGPSNWQHCRESDASILAKRADYELRRVYVPAAQQAPAAEPVAYVDHADGSVIWKGKRLPGGSLLYAAPQPPQAQPLTDALLLQAVRSTMHGTTIRLTRDVGPYEVTEPTHELRRLAAAILMAVGIKGAA